MNKKNGSANKRKDLFVFLLYEEIRFCSLSAQLQLFLSKSKPNLVT
jgi:hypothetical protein